MQKLKVVGVDVASNAAKTLNSSCSSAKSKTAAGSALSQGRGTSSGVARAAASTLTQKASQVKSPAKTGSISRTAARSAILSVSKAGKK